MDINLVWGQAVQLYKEGFACDLTPEEIKENEEYNRQFNIITSEYELIQKYLSPGTKDSHDCHMTATDILLHLAEYTGNKIKLNTIIIGKAMKMLSFPKSNKYPDRKYGYYVYKKFE